MPYLGILQQTEKARIFVFLLFCLSTNDEVRNVAVLALGVTVNFFCLSQKLPVSL